ncbi:site-2 protease family protein [soil metagenome]
MFRSKGIRLGRLLGIPVFIHPSWFIAFFILTSNGAEQFATSSTDISGKALVLSAIATIIAFASLLAHEFGHALAARYFKIQTERITLLIFGGVAEIRSEPRSPLQEFVIALAGPAVSLVLSGIFFAMAYAIQTVSPTHPFYMVATVVALLNMVFAVFNLIPGFPMDGGRVLRAFLWKVTGNFVLATKIAAIGGRTFGGLLAATGVALLSISIFGVIQGGGGFDPSGIVLIGTGIFIAYLASLSWKQVKLKDAFDQVAVRDLMRPVSAIVSAEMTISEVVRDFVYRYNAERFPVIRGNQLIGSISADDISRTEKSQWGEMRAEKLTRPFKQEDIVVPDQNALQAFQKASAAGRQQLLVFRGRTLVGMLFAQDVLNHVKKLAGDRVVL